MFNYVTIPVHQPVMFNRSDRDLEHCVIWFCQKKVPGPSLKQTAKESLESWKANPFCLMQLSWRKEGSEVRLRWSGWMETSKPWDSSPLNHLLDPFGRIVLDLFPSASWPKHESNSSKNLAARKPRESPCPAIPEGKQIDECLNQGPCFLHMFFVGPSC